ncbi:hypothetical protein TspCOW1_00300 [Thiohalobacter sp. COW1]|nr:hypothetical protein TspCOW1_00300 [Thiohalobacter sp. COW1]
MADGAAQVVRDQQRRDPAEEGEGALVGGDPVRQPLRPGRLGVGVAGGAEHGDEDLRVADLAAGRVDHLDGRPAVVDEQLLSGLMKLAHAALLPTGPVPIQVAVAAVTIGALAVGGGVLGPLQLQGHALAFEFLVDGGEIRFDQAHRRLGDRKQLPLQGRIVEVLRQRPAQSLGLTQAQILGDGALGDPDRSGDFFVAQPRLMAQA